MYKAKQKGFTLIELIVVIVILGILAVTAAPKFINFTSDAHEAALSGVRGGISSAMAVTNAKAAIEGQESASTPAAITGIDGQMVFGYPTAAANGIILAAGISAGQDGEDDFVYAEVPAVGGNPAYLVLAPSSKTTIATAPVTETEITNTACYITYNQATATTVATVTDVKTSC